MGADRRVSIAVYPCNMQARGAARARRKSSEASLTVKVQAKSKLGLERHDSCLSESTNSTKQYPRQPLQSLQNDNRATDEPRKGRSDP
jgi:hypothetical protein